MKQDSTTILAVHLSCLKFHTVEGIDCLPNPTAGTVGMDSDKHGDSQGERTRNPAAAEMELEQRYSGIHKALVAVLDTYQLADIPLLLGAR
jgi:hypothetical protein